MRFDLEKHWAADHYPDPNPMLVLANGTRVAISLQDWREAHSAVSVAVITGPDGPLRTFMSLEAARLLFNGEGVVVGIEHDKVRV